MPSLGIGDLAQSHMLQRRNISIRQEMLRLTDELASGQVSDIRQILDGNYGQMTDIERALETLDGYSVATTEARLYADGVQEALGQVEELSSELAMQLLVAGSAASSINGADIAEEARLSLDAIVASLNARQAGRNLFSGTATDRPPLVSSNQLLTDLSAAIAGATTPDDMLAAAAVWFDNPAGFTATSYLGSGDNLNPFDLSDRESVDLSLRADDPQLRVALRNVAVAALADDPTFGLTTEQQSELFGKSSALMLGGRDDVISLRSRIGFAQARLETVTARNAAEDTSLQMARGALVSADPFQTATDLESVQFQLQSLYSVTVRMSQLSLVNFL